MRTPLIHKQIPVEPEKQVSVRSFTRDVYDLAVWRSSLITSGVASSSLFAAGRDGAFKKSRRCGSVRGVRDCELVRAWTLKLLLWILTPLLETECIEARWHRRFAIRSQRTLGAKVRSDRWFFAVDGPIQWRALINRVPDVQSRASFHQ